MAGNKNQVTLTFGGDSRQLEKTFDKVESASDKMARKVESDGGVFERLGSGPGPANAGVKAASGFALSFNERIGPLIAKAPISGPLASLAVAAVPAIAAAISSGLLLALGGGVLAAGIALVAKHEKVTSAFEDLKSRFLDIDTTESEKEVAKLQQKLTNAYKGFNKARTDASRNHWAREIDEAKRALDDRQAHLKKLQDSNKKNFSLRDAAQPFLEPTARALRTFAESADKIVPSFARMAQTIAPVLDKLAPAFAEMAERSLPGIEKAVAASVPLFEKLAEHAPLIGDAISRFFEKIAEGGPSTVKFLDVILQGAEVALPMLADALYYLTGSFLAMHAMWTAIFKGIDAGWDGLKKAVGAAVNYVTGSFNALVAFLRALPGRAGAAFTGMFDGVKHAFRSALNWVVDRWNNFSIPGINTPFGAIGGFDTPNLPRFHQGGVVPGAPGTEMVALLQAGERVTPAGRGETIVLEIHSGGSEEDDYLVRRLSRAVRVRGGNVQLALGGSRG